MSRPVTRAASGLDVPLLAPRPDHIRFRDVAQHLAQINMFRGGAMAPYSLAQHSLLASTILEAGRNQVVH